MQPKVCKTKALMIHYHLSKEKENAPLDTKFFYTLFSQGFLPRTYRGVRLWQRQETLQTSSTSSSLKNVHCRVAGTKQMSFSNVRIDQCKSVTIVLHQLSLHKEKPQGELKALWKQPEGKKVFLVIGRTHLDSHSFRVVLNKNDKATRIQGMVWT